jgi:hypothetical protein
VRKETSHFWFLKAINCCIANEDVKHAVLDQRRLAVIQSRLRVVGFRHPLGGRDFVAL